MKQITRMASVVYVDIKPPVHGTIGAVIGRSLRPACLVPMIDRLVNINKLTNSPKHYAIKIKRSAFK